MPIRVDLPAPFSPTMPWIVPAPTVSETSRLACTSPNHLSIPRNSTAGSACAFSMGRSERRLCRRNSDVCHTPRDPGGLGGSRPPQLLGIVRHLDLSGHDVGPRLGQAALHLRGDQPAIVLIQRVADAAL